MLTQKYLNDLTYTIIGAAIEIHKELGPGLLESIYEKCLEHELKEKGLMLRSQQKVPVLYKGNYLDCDLRYDLLVENSVVVEVKAVEALAPIHEAQLLTYLNLLNKCKGLLLNFNCVNIFKEGQRTLVTRLFSDLPKGY
jgi:GxxExxY protein